MLPIKRMSIKLANNRKMTREILTHKYYKLELLTTEKILKLDWTGKTSEMNDQDFKDCLLEYVHLINEHKANKL